MCIQYTALEMPCRGTKIPTSLRPELVLTAPNSTSKKLRLLRACRILKQGGIIAHETATLPGIAATPCSSQSEQRMQHFKQRRGPFLLLADSTRTALHLARFFSPELRKLARRSWPGPVTLVFAARPGLPKSCHQHSMLAVRVDADVATRRAAKCCGGLLLSSSLNRKGGLVRSADRKSHMRWHRHLNGRVSGVDAQGSPSIIIRIWRNSSTMIRP
jgi:L-threonylcarbamoyladenylate synthase